MRASAVNVRLASLILTRARPSGAMAIPRKAELDELDVAGRKLGSGAEEARVVRVAAKAADDDAYGHMNNARYFELIDTAVNAHLADAVGSDIAMLTT